MLAIHNNIKTKLHSFLANKIIPNIIFHGPPGGGKKTILRSFLEDIYKNVELTYYVMKVNCGHGKGIKFIREELKFFCKANVNSAGGELFKSIVLLNADKLTCDAQSALRRCIEIYNHTTRFFMIVESKSKLLKPILSRFCEIYIPLPRINKKNQSLHTYHIDAIFSNAHLLQQQSWLKRTLNSFTKTVNTNNLLDLTNKLYDRGIHIFNLMDYLEKDPSFDNELKYYYLVYFDKVRKEFKNEQLLMFKFLYFLYMRPMRRLENISVI